MNIYLVGFMGTGKSAVGKELAKIKKWRFMDLDESIEAKEKRYISDIFVKEGEPHFRKLERKALQAAAKKKNLVVACGGGIVINPDNIKLMKKTGIMVCLTARPDVILERTHKFKHRPLLNVKNPKIRIAELLKTRASYYACADKSIDTSKIPVKEVVNRILKLILRKAKG